MLFNKSGPTPPALPDSPEGSEERFRLLVESVSDYAIFMLDPEGYVASWNAGAERLKGYRPEEIIGRHFSRFYTEEDIQRSHPEEELVAALRDGRYEEEGWRVRKDGSCFWANVVITALRDGEGALRGFAKVTRDLTERRRAEEALRHANEALEERVRERTAELTRAHDALHRRERELADFVENATVGLHWVAGDGTIVWANKAELDLLGYAPEEYIGHPIAEFHADPHVIADILTRLSGNQKLQEYEARLRCKDGSIKHVLIDSSVMWEGERFGHTRCFTRDVTERKQAEEALRAREAELRATTDAVPAMIALVDPERRYRFANLGYQQWFGISRDAIRGKRVRDVLGKAAWKHVKPHAERALAGEMTSFECELPHRDGTLRWVQAVYTPYADESGAVCGFVTLIQEITERKRKEQAQQFIVEASRILASSLDYQTTLQSVARLAVPAVADWCAVDVVDEAGRTQRLAVQHVDPEKSELAYEMERRYPVDPEAAHGLPKVLRTGEAEFYPAIPDAVLVEGTRDAEHLRMARELGLKSAIVVPLMARGRTLGAITLVTAESGRLYSLEDLALAQGLAQRAALAVDNALLYQEAQAEARARFASEQQARAIFDHVTDAIMVADDEMRYVDANPAACRLAGLAREKLLELHVSDLFPAGLSEGVAAVWADFVQEGAQTGELALQLPDGTQRDVEYTAKANFLPSRHLSVLRDITQRKADELERLRLLAQERRHHARQRGLTQASLAINASLSLGEVLARITEQSREIIGANLAVTRLLAEGEGAAPIDTVSLSDRFSSWQEDPAWVDGCLVCADVSRLSRPLRLTQEELEAHSAWRERCKEAASPPMRGLLAAPLAGRDGRNIGLILLSDKYEGEFREDDEAALVQLAQLASVAVENARLYQELQEADQRKDQFLAMLAHELRNPLAPIRNATQVLKMRVGEAPGVRKTTDALERQVQHMTRLVDDLLDASRLTHGKIELLTEPVELAAMITHVVETSRPYVEERRHDLQVLLPREPVFLDADATRLEQALGNLLHNAAKFTPPGGRIRLSVEVERGSKASPAASSSPTTVLIRVRDTGRGIPGELLPHVFDLFTQADQSLAHTEGGLGIGLALVRGLVEMHGGAVQAFSDGPGQGSEFIVRLPMAEGGVRGAEASHPAAPQSALRIPPSRRVLVVEDNLDSAETLVDLLELWGHEVRAVHDGPAAVRTAADFRPEVVLLDIGLPGMDGFEAARRLRAGLGEDARLMALTGYSQEEDRRRSSEAGCDHHLVKPINPDELRRLLESIVPATGGTGASHDPDNQARSMAGDPQGVQDHDA
jgi:PAS domain S-box-containing protein